MVRPSLFSVLLLLVCSSAFAQGADTLSGGTGDVKSGTVAKEPAAADGSQPSAATPEGKDCHGPLYYRLKEEDRVNRERETSFGVMEAFVHSTSKVLYPAQKAELDQLFAEQQKTHAQCLQEHPQPATLCLAMARRDAGLCQYQPSPEQQQWCNHLLLAYEAVTTRNAAPCGKINLAAERALCEFVVAGDFNCQQLDGEMAAACEALAAALSGAQLPADMPEEARSALQWIVAVKRQESASCDALSDDADRSACKALLKADPAICPSVRPLEEYVDGDFSCRQPLLYKAEHPAAWGNLVALTVATAMAGPGQCEVSLDLLENGQKRTMKADDASLAGNGDYEHYHLFTGQGRLIDVRVSCRWSPPGASPGGDQR